MLEVTRTHKGIYGYIEQKEDLNKKTQPLWFYSVWITMDKKILISLTGTTCAGKSTLLKAIKEAYDDVFIIPQVTTRQPRSDDDHDLIKYSDTLDKNKMFLYNKELSYGIEQIEIDNFLLSDKSYAVAINGSDEIEMLKSKSLDLLSYKNVLLTFTKDYNTEIEALSKQLKNQI